MAAIAEVPVSSTPIPVPVGVASKPSGLPQIPFLTEGPVQSIISLASGRPRGQATHERAAELIDIGARYKNPVITKLGHQLMTLANQGFVLSQKNQSVFSRELQHAGRELRAEGVASGVLEHAVFGGRATSGLASPQFRALEGQLARLSQRQASAPQSPLPMPPARPLPVVPAPVRVVPRQVPRPPETVQVPRPLIPTGPETINRLVRPIQTAVSTGLKAGALVLGILGQEGPATVVGSMGELLERQPPPFPAPPSTLPSARLQPSGRTPLGFVRQPSRPPSRPTGFQPEQHFPPSPPPPPLPQLERQPAKTLDLTKPCSTCGEIKQLQRQTSRQIVTEENQGIQSRLDDITNQLATLQQLETQPAETRNIPDELAQKQAILTQLSQLSDIAESQSESQNAEQAQTAGAAQPTPVAGPQAGQVQSLATSGEAHAEQQLAESQAQPTQKIQFCVGCTSNEEAVKFLNGEPSECSVVQGSYKEM